MPRSFAIVPAAGHSTRMGRPKLLLPIAGRPLILHTLAAWQASRVMRIVVVVRPDDELLAEVVRATGVDLAIPPIAPPDMKASINYGLKHIEQTYFPAEADAWLVAPADMPGLSPLIINRLIDEAAVKPDRVIIPTLGGRRGHPVLLPWPLTARASQLAEGQGLATLIDGANPLLLPCDALDAAPTRAFADIDTPEELNRFSEPI